jgi:spermidine synthase
MSEKDEAAFHEMLAHIPLFAHPKPQNILVLGGGDGGTAREALRHPEVQKVHMVEQDPLVPEAAKLFPRFREVFENEALRLEIGDALGTLRRLDSQSIDVILLDAQDAIQPDPSLFSAGFFAEVARVLKPNGIFATQAGAPALEPEILQHTQAQLKPHFQHIEAYLTTLSTLPTGLCVFLIAKKEGKVNFNAAPPKEKFKTLEAKESLQYYTPKIHAASFALPRFVEVLMR